MEHYLAHIFIPMILSNVLHMVIVKKNAFSFLTIPLSKTLFGQNKTLRGLMVLPVMNGVFFWVVNCFLPVFENWEALIIGAVLGLSYVLFELPNSFLKRRMGIASGQRAKKNSALFLLLDKMDSAFGVSLVSKFLLGLSWTEAGLLFLIAIVIHAFFSWLLVVIRIKRRF